MIYIYTENPDRDLRKINMALTHIQTDFQQLQTALGTVSKAFKENLDERKNQTNEKICKIYEKHPAKKK